ncbi:MAG: hypothetical protein AAGI92_01820 [Pseudomonadota bacterium]
MSAAPPIIGNYPALSKAEINRALTTRLSALCLFFGPFLSGFVIAEPAPYELYMAGLIGVWAVLGLRISQTVGALLAILIVFNIGGIVSMTQMDDWTGAPLYIAVSFFLAGTSVFIAAVIEADHRRLKPIIIGWTAAATITGLLGIAGYFGFAGETFTRFGRAKGAFEDPNVFGPFLALPAIYCLGTLLTKPLSRPYICVSVLSVLTLATFLSFSRAAWGMYAFSVISLVLLLLLINPSNRFRLRVIMLAVFAVFALVGALVIALQIDGVAEMFSTRAQLVQEYDGARLGRFARHGMGFAMAMEHPLGLGILQFAGIFGEDQHNVYLKALWDYSWLGFAAYMLLILLTLGLGVRFMLRDRPWRLLLMCSWIVFLGHVIVGYVIDTDHWRHFFLLLGIIWGCAALEIKWQRSGNGVRT